MKGCRPVILLALGLALRAPASLPPVAPTKPHAPPSVGSDENWVRDIERLLRSEQQRLSLETDVERLKKERDRLEEQKRQLEAERARLEAESARVRQQLDNAGPGRPDSGASVLCMALARAPLSQQGKVVREAPPMTVVTRLSGAADGRIRVRWDGAEYEAAASDFAPETVLLQGLDARIREAETELAQRRADREKNAGPQAAAERARLDAEIGLLETRLMRARTARQQIEEAFRQAETPPATPSGG